MLEIMTFLLHQNMEDVSCWENVWNRKPERVKDQTYNLYYSTIKKGVQGSSRITPTDLINLLLITAW